jgi:hypothetical protein
VELPADWTDHDCIFYVEENHCPGTAEFGSYLYEQIEKHDKQATCWGCALGGKNEIISPINRE